MTLSWSDVVKSEVSSNSSADAILLQALQAAEEGRDTSSSLLWQRMLGCVLPRHLYSFWQRRLCRIHSQNMTSLTRYEQTWEPGYIAASCVMDCKMEDGVVGPLAPYNHSLSGQLSIKVSMMRCQRGKVRK